MPEPGVSAHLRLAVVGVVVLSLFVALFSRLLYLQVMDAKEFEVQARNNRVRIVYEAAPRGRILDRHDRVLVDNRAANVITLSREAAKESPAVVDRLAALLGVAAESIAKRVNDPRFSPFTPVPVVDEASEEAIIFVREHQDEFEGVEATRIAQRTYPHGTLAAHLLGNVRKANQAELDAHRAEQYRPGDDIGKAGVELAYEKWLRGDPGETRLEVDANDRVVRTLYRKPPVPGHDVRLTVDLDVQRAAEAALARSLGAARGAVDRQERKNFLAPAGSAVVVDPRDGAVRALASAPTYDPAIFVGGIPIEDYKVLLDPANHFPLTNRAIGGGYSPASTFKLATAIAGLKEGLIEPRTTIEDTGVYRLRNCKGDRCVYQNAGRVPYGRVDLARALTVSSDVYFYSMGAQFWTQRSTYGDAMQEAARDLGLGRRTGIELAGEIKGVVPDPAIRKQRNEDNPVAFPNGQWRTGDNINLSIGQGEMVVSPLQLAQAYATFAKGGRAFVPRIASDVIAAGEAVEGGQRPVPAETFGPKPLREMDLPAEVRDPILAGLRGVVSDPKGTAAGAFSGFPLSTFSVAGKTGTAQVTGKQDTALFSAFGPVEDPAWVVTVVLEEAGFGGAVAAPVARRIFDAIIGRGVDAAAPDVVASGVD